MAGFWGRRGLIFLIVVFTFGIVENSKLNVPRVLLPLFRSFKLKFVLEGTERECYKWSTSRPEILDIQPLSEDFARGCASKAIVSSISKEFERNTAIVFAEELRSGHILRCDVILDVIHSLNVITTSRELYIEEAPEAFEIRAYDDQGNEFSSLEGVEFKWTLSTSSSQGDDVKGTNVIRFMTFNESPYETPPTVLDLDGRGQRGHIILLEGLKTGSAKVMAELPYPEYSCIKPVVVQLYVMSNIIISPAEIYLITGDSVEYRVMQVQNGRLEEIHLLSQQYYWEIQDPEIATFDEKSYVATALSTGKTRVILHDRNIDENEKVARIPSANLVVSEPAYLTLNILPYHNWAVLVGEFYEIVVNIYDKDDNKLHVGDVAVTTVVPSEYFQVQIVSKNGTYMYGQPLATGTAQVRSTLDAVKNRQGKRRSFNPKIAVQANLMIYKPIFVTPADVILPWEPILKPRYVIPLNVTGGDGSFVWSSSNRTVATVTQMGAVTTYANGRVSIQAAMTSNPQNRGIAKFHIVPPKVIEIVDFMQETEIGKEIFLHVALFTRKQFIKDKASDDQRDSQDLVHFTQCDQVPFIVRVWEDIFFHNTSLHTKPSGVACTAIGITALGLGTTKVSISYDLPSNPLSTQVSVASYKPVTVLFPESGELVLAVGCSANVMFTGGPLPWMGQTSENVRKIDCGGELSVVSVTDEYNPSAERQDLYIYNVLCKQLGEAEVTLSISNKPVVKQSGRSESSASIRIFCAKPRYLVLRPEIDNPTKTSCPINLNTERVVAQSFTDVKLEVIVQDAHGRHFHNISSLQLDWTLSDETLASVVKPEFVQLESDGNVPPKLLFYQMLQPHGKTGILEVRAAVVGYHSHILRNLDIVPEYPPFAVVEDKGYDVTPDISAVLNIIWVNDAHISPKYTIMFNHPKNKLVLNVHEGSGFYELILSTDEIAEVIHQEGSKVIEITPVAEGILKLAIADLCLPSEPTLAEINVVSIGTLHVEAPERVEKGRCVPGLLRIYDSMDNLLPIPRPDLLDLQSHIDEEIMQVTMLFEKDPDGNVPGLGEVHFIITGLELGEKHISFSAGHAYKEIHSESIPIQVFSPLKLLPNNITLVVGSVFQVSTRGGPLPDANIEYSVSGKVVSVDKTGLVEGLKVGSCELIARAFGIHRSTGQRIVYSQDSLEVNVVPLKGITINSPITKIINGAKLPLWANGIPEQITPLILGSAKLPVKYKWGISNDIGTIYNVYHYAGFQTNEMDLITMHFQGLKPGKVTISLNVSVPAQMTSRMSGSEVEFVASLELEVFEELRLLEPSTAGEIQSPKVIMAPNSATYLKTSHEGNIQFSIIDSQAKKGSNRTGNSSSELSEVAPIVTVDSNGLLKSSSTHGRCVVLITIKEDFGFKQVLQVAVEVKTVRFMLVSLRPEFKIKESEMISFLPRGAEIPLGITYHDSAGRPFDAFDTSIKLRMNRYDLTKIQQGHAKHIITAKVLNHGITMLKLWDDMTLDYVTEYTRLKSADGILPLINEVSLGDIVCFYVPFLPQEENIAGIWTSENSAVMEINTALGIGRARAVGTTIIKFHFSPSIYTSKEIKVLPLARVKLLPMKEYFITNSDPGAMFRVPVVLRHGDEQGKMNNLFSHEGSCPSGYVVSSFPYFCSLQWTNSTEFDIDDIFATTQDFSLESGQYTCDIVASGDPPPILSTLDTNITLNVECGTLEVYPQHFRFFPSIYISTPEIHLSDAQMSGTLIVSGVSEVLNKLQVVPGNSLISVSKSTDRVVESASVYIVLLSERYWSVGELSTRMNVTVISPLTKQSLQVPLKVHLIGEKGHIRSPCLVSHVTTWSGFFSDVVYAYRHTLLISATLLLIIIATAYGISSFTPSRRESLYVPYGNRRATFVSPAMYGRSYTDVGDVYGDPRRYSTVPQEFSMSRQNLVGDTWISRPSTVAPRVSVSVRPRKSAAWT